MSQGLGDAEMLSRWNYPYKNFCKFIF